MSITLDVNDFLNKDVCSQSGCNGGGSVGVGHIDDEGGVSISMEKQMETNIFDEIEHLLKFNKNLEFSQDAAREDDRKTKSKKTEDHKPPPPESFSLDFLSHTDDFLLASETQSLLGEDPLLFSVEQDRLQPLTSKFMVPGIYKRIEGVDNQDHNKTKPQKSNVFITDIEKTGRILTEQEFDRLYDLSENSPHNPVRKVLLVEPLYSHDYEDTDKGQENNGQAEKKSEIPKEWDTLNRLAYDILKLANRDHIVIDRKRNEVVRTQHRTNQKTIYRFWQPEMLGLKYQDSEASLANVKGGDMPEKPKIKLGRPRKRQKEDEDEVLKRSQKVGKSQEESPSTAKEIKPDTILKPLPHSRTRSGRLVRVPTTSQQTFPDLSIASPEDSIANLLNDLKDISYHNSKIETINSKNEQPPPPPPPPPPSEPDPPIETPATSPPKRKVPPEAICPTCHKIFLGRRLQRHFAQHPDHIKIPTATADVRQAAQKQEGQLLNSQTESSNSAGEDMSLFRFLVSKLQRSQQLNEDQKADLFLSELNDLVEQLQLRSSRLIRNTSGLHFVNQRCSKLLGIPEGQYALDLAAIEAPIEPDMQDNAHSHNLTTSSSSLPNHINTRSLDYTNLSITLDDTLTDEAAQKLNLSAGGKLLPPSEESLLRAVDDLVQTDINKIQTTAVCVSDTSLVSSNANTTSVVGNLLPPHIDHVSDNAVEAVHMKETSSTVVNASENPLLDLSVDFFQFNN